MKNYLYAISTLIGTVIGVGLFGLPYVTMKSGFFTVFFYFIVIGIVMLLLQFMYAEATLQQKSFHQFPGYAEKYLGKQFKKYALILLTLGTYGALLAYIIVGGQFAYQLLSPFFGGTATTYQIGFFLLGALLVYRGLKSIAKAEFYLLLIFLAIVVILFVVGFPKMHLENIFNGTPTKNIFFPYGVVIFSLWGLDIIAVIEGYVDGNVKKLKKIITQGLIICILVYLVFIITVLGVSGEHTTVDALDGLKAFLSDRVLILGYLFGIITTFTSFISLGIVLKSSFVEDFKIPPELSWFVSMFVPLAMFAFGMKNFLSVMNITGAITLGIEGVFICTMYLHILKNPKYNKHLYTKIPRGVVFAVATILTTGVFAEIFFSVISK